ncbi:hypothetical protein VdG1_03460 [Verticillium dahliae VDG1]|nr:hypothetical protein VdG1_03460 [Verticillium dahliae VDG1]
MILCVLTSGDNAFNAPASSLPPPPAPAWHNPQRVHRNSTLVLSSVSAVRGPVTPHRLPARHRLHAAVAPPTSVPAARVRKGARHTD